MRRRFALLWLKNGGNTVLRESDGYVTKENAIETFNEWLKNDGKFYLYSGVVQSVQGNVLDKNGYCKVNEHISLTIAEHLN